MQTYELKLYRGYANDQELVLSGHVFREYPIDQNLYTRQGLVYLRSILQLFTPRIEANTEVILRLDKQEIRTRTLTDGFFRFSVPLSHPLPSGWFPYEVCVYPKGSSSEPLIRAGEVLVPHSGHFTIISDIDDTFLMSYSDNVLKKLYVMLTRNVESRLPFEDVVTHYRLLSFAGRNAGGTETNTFFYVSSSEWNLYDYINLFSTKHQLPKAVLHLKKIKTRITEFFKSGGGSHEHKQRKIEHIMEFYPHQQFILLGDDSQQDPYIYENICKMFPCNTFAVYIRQTNHSPKTKVSYVMQNIEQMGVKTCYFRHSSEAIRHSVDTGIVSQEVWKEFVKEEVVATV